MAKIITLNPATGATGPAARPEIEIRMEEAYRAVNDLARDMRFKRQDPDELLYRVGRMIMLMGMQGGPKS